MADTEIKIERIEIPVTLEVVDGPYAETLTGFRMTMDIVATFGDVREVENG